MVYANSDGRPIRQRSGGGGHVDSLKISSTGQISWQALTSRSANNCSMISPIRTPAARMDDRVVDTVGTMLSALI